MRPVDEAAVPAKERFLELKQADASKQRTAIAIE
jgi:hypothetical protein